MNIVGVQPESVGAVWSVAGLLLSDALARGGDDYTLAEVRGSLERGESMLWLIEDGEEAIAALVSYINPARSALTVWLMAGRSMDEWVEDALHLLQRYALEHGLRYVDAHMRPGLARRLQPLGWRVVQVVSRIEVDYEQRKEPATERRTDGHESDRAPAVA